MNDISVVQFLENYFGVVDENRKKIFEEAHKMHKQEIIDAWNSAGGGDAYHQGKEYYQETFVSKGSDECQFEPTTNTSSATICKHCGREKYLHKI